MARRRLLGRSQTEWSGGSEGLRRKIRLFQQRPEDGARNPTNASAGRLVGQPLNGRRGRDGGT